jgi:apolipoprotein N-acyltransferase
MHSKYYCTSIFLSDAKLGAMRTIPLRLWALAILSAIAQLMPFPLAGPVPLWRRAFCWFCLTPLLIAVLGQTKQGMPLRPLQAALLGYLAGFLWYVGNCYWIYQTMHIYGSIPGPGSLGILFLFSLYLGLYQAMYAGLLSFFRCKYSTSIALIISPFLWVAFELGRARITGFPWDLLGYAQVDNALLTKLAPIGGVMLLSFVIGSVGALFAAAWFATRPVSRLGLLAGAIVLMTCLQAGVFYHPRYEDAKHIAALLQEDLAVGAEGREIAPLSTEQKYQQFTDLSLNPRSSEQQGSSQISWAPVPQPREEDLIVWPEAPADFATSDPVFRADLSGLARAAATPVIAGSIGVDFDPSVERGYHEYGSAAVFDKDGTYLGRYDKIHRVPWGEYVPYKPLFFFAGNLVSGVGNMEAGKQHTIFHLNGHGVGIFICYESIFGDEVREFAKDGAEVFVNISDDGWYGDTSAPWQHLDMARMRAIENRRWILRDTNTGVTTAIDPEGRGIFTTPRHLRAAFAFPFDYRRDTTFYTRHGDWFAWICVFLTVLLLGVGLTRPVTQPPAQ